jgi:3-isopropylmalate/(R)-2-methylmalate dehydratase large subunit
VTAKDLVLHLIGRHGAGGGGGSAIEFAGDAVRQLPVEGRLTLCNMAVEFGAWTGVVAPDDSTIEYVRGRPYAPIGTAWDSAVAAWRDLESDEAAYFDTEIALEVGELGPQVSWGTSPQHIAATDGRVPSPGGAADRNAREAMERALQYMDLQPGQALSGVPIDAAFIGSCTNARLSDLREAGAVLRGRKVSAGVRALCVPGSSTVKRAAEAEGLDAVFREAGFEWRESGCSLCFYAGGEGFSPGDRVISSTNRNFEGRQGPGTRTHLASPATVAASAVLGRIGHAGELS